MARYTASPAVSISKTVMMLGWFREAMMRPSFLKRSTSWGLALRGVQDLEHDGTPERFLDGQIRGRHPAFSDRVANAVALDLHGGDYIGVNRPLVC
jgi:hypothetical protein